MDADTYQAFVAAPLCSEPLISCSRFHHNSAVLLGSAAHATFPDMHVSASAGLEVRAAPWLRKIQVGRHLPSN